MIASDLATHLRGKKKTISDLVAYIQNGNDTQNYSLFLGAGASKNSGIETALDLVKHWRKEAYHSLFSAPSGSETEEEMIKWLQDNQASWYSPSAEYSSLFERKFSLNRQRRDFIERQVSGKSPSIGYPYLVKMAEKHFLNSIFTTNFDDLLNEAFYQFSSIRPVVCAHDSAVAGISVASARPKIIKLHGDYLFENLRSTQNETNKLDINMDEKLKEFLKVYGLIIAGYSGGDNSIMRILNDLLDDTQYLQNGLYWCFRENDTISSEILKILKKDKSFYVIIEGFDEMMAEMYDGLCGADLPFTARPGSDFAAKTVSGYLKNPSLSTSKCPVIKKHLLKLSEEQNGSMVLEALKNLHSEKNHNTSIKDLDLVKYIDLERLFYARDYSHAFDKIKSYITECEDTEFKKVLLHRKYICAKKLYRLEEASKTVDAMAELEPDNYFIPLAKCNVVNKHADKLEILRLARERAPFEETIQMRYAEELEESFNYSETSAQRTRAEDVVREYKAAISLSPTIENPAWRNLFNFINNAYIGIQNREETLEWIISEHLKQDSYDARSMRMLYDYCRKNQTDEYQKKHVAVWIVEAFKNHFPHNHAAHLRVLCDACIRYDQYAALREAIEHCEKLAYLTENPNYIMAKMDIMYTIYRDLGAAIRLGELYISKRKNIDIEEKLFRFYLDFGNLIKARSQLDGLKWAIDHDDYLELKAMLLEYESKFQDAIDTIKTIPDHGGFIEKHATSISFLQLKMGDFLGASATAKKLLDLHNFSYRFEETIINYEYGKLKSKGNFSKARISELINKSDDKCVKGVALLMSGQKSKALDTLREECELNFCNINRFLRWPVLSELTEELIEIKKSLISMSRVFPSSLDEENNIVDIHTEEVEAISA